MMKPFIFLLLLCFVAPSYASEATTIGIIGTVFFVVVLLVGYAVLVLGTGDTAKSDESSASPANTQKHHATQPPSSKSR